MMKYAAFCFSALFGCLLGCGQAAPPRPELGQPLDVPSGAWTWVDFPDSACDDGSPTGLGINRTESKNLIVFMMGGGACWEYDTCYVLNTATHGPMGKTQFEQLLATAGSGSVLDRGLAQNPFRDWNMVLVPYCTGDIHGGDTVQMYRDKVYHHKGRANIIAFLKRVAATWPSPDNLVVSGSSAGGFGAAVNYDVFRRYFPGNAAYLLDDSGPVLVGDAIPQTLRDAWYNAWGLDHTLGAFCPECRDDLSLLVPRLSRTFPSDRMALLESLQDQTIRGFFLQSGSDFQVNLLAFAQQRLDPAPNFRYFFVPGQTHTMLPAPDKFSSQGVPLWTWLSQFVADDPAWKSLKPATMP